jgi:hypothetical protein
MTFLVLALGVMTMRVDYYHIGNATQEQFTVDRVVIEPQPWPGNPSRPIDTTNRGLYLFRVVDLASGKAIYSRGFNSIYGEWQTTDEARKISRTFSESLRFPAPPQPVRITLEKRDRQNQFQAVWDLTVDPADKFIVRQAPMAVGSLIKLHEAGDPVDKLDLLILGDGYTAAERRKFERDARRLVQILFSTTPFKERQRDINVWGLCPPAARSGISRPSDRVFRQSPVGLTYDAFGTERYMLTFENKAFRDIAGNAPYDFVEIIANSSAYGGGGIFGQFSAVAAHSGSAAYIFVHEFGHHIAALADEYYTSDVAYLPPAEKVEPWEPNVTALLDRAALKWRSLVMPGTPIPTPWPKEEFDQYAKLAQDRRRALREAGRPESEMDALLKEIDAHTAAILSGGPYARRLGAFEGANYESRGYYRPQQDCIMFSRDRVPFCLVCRQAVEDMLDLYSRH